MDFNHAGIQGQRFLPDVETAIYRILQEALTNIARHAGVRDATVQIRVDESTLNVMVDDRGNGFDSEVTTETGRGTGIAGMRERAISLNGRFTIKSKPGAGTRLTVSLPIGRTRTEKE